MVEVIAVIHSDTFDFLNILHSVNVYHYIVLDSNISIDITRQFMCVCVCLVCMQVGFKCVCVCVCVCK